jgi:hypothetical protein
VRAPRDLTCCPVCDQWYCGAQCHRCGQPAPPAATHTKYGSRRTTVDGVTFDSAKEAKRFGELVMMQQAGHISGLRRQVPFDLVVNGHKVATYRADFTYSDASGLDVVEDVKGFRTPVYKLKRRLMLACWGVDIREV